MDTQYIVVKTYYESLYRFEMCGITNFKLNNVSNLISFGAFRKEGKEIVVNNIYLSSELLFQMILWITLLKSIIDLEYFWF